MGFRATLNVRKFKVALNPMCRIFFTGGQFFDTMIVASSDNEW